ncbi:hypothetical protein [Colwellia ponticola]|uniref:EF-hand domain-containing protein n=1 Tax=Colwellia ponticola TaxID=2304625 RepID=A0A8H2JP90_9GAMM|nr:hypothetical protein [Colwellia ponticola]TMM47569.1 hypothetical protein FCS21_00880 [Colwellia ponticola]
MNSNNLTQISALVVIVSMASFLVIADDALTNKSEQNTLVYAETSVKTVVVETPVVKEPGDKFTFTSLDTDKNGKLSQQEAEQGKNEWLKQSFKKIDSNADKAITEQELVDFVAKKAATRAPTMSK